jgi:hypothetical protein
VETSGDEDFPSPSILVLRGGEFTEEKRFRWPLCRPHLRAVRGL